MLTAACRTTMEMSFSKRTGSNVLIYVLILTEAIKDGNQNPLEPVVVCLLAAERPSNMTVYLGDGSAQTSLRAATLR